MANTSRDIWIIEGVNYRGKVIPVTLSRKLLPAMNLGQMIAHAQKAMQIEEFYSANVHLVHTIARRAKEMRNSEVRDFMKETIFSQYPNTLSVVRYHPSGKLDEIVHNPKLFDEYSFKVDFVSPDEFVKGSKRKRDYNILLGAKSPKEVHNVWKHVTGKDAYIWKFNSKPINTDERVVRLYANSDGFVLYCLRNRRGARASFGVQFPQKI